MDVEKVLVGNEEFEGKTVSRELNPHDGSTVGEVFDADLELTKLAGKKSLDYFRSVKGGGSRVYERIDLLYDIANAIEKNSERISSLTTKENGRPIKLTQNDVKRTVSIFKYTAEYGRIAMEGIFHEPDAFPEPKENSKRIVVTIKEPLGGILAITPFNAPLAQFAFKVAPAILTGCPIVVKPSPFTSISSLLLGKIIRDSGIPDGALSVLSGGKDVVNNTMDLDIIRLVTFTGSTKIGKEIASRASFMLKKVVLELGGSDPLLVLEDANISSAAHDAVASRFSAAGQACNTTKRVFVDKKVKEEFEELLLLEVKKIRVGDPLDKNTDMGPLISRDARISLLNLVRDSAKNGAKLICGGQEISGNGNYMEPTIITDNSKWLFDLDTEIFGPVLPIYSFSTDDEAVEMINSSRYGLQSSIYTEDIRRGYELSRRIQSGAVIINEPDRLRWDFYSFGGVKESGIGREGVVDGVNNYLERKVLSMRVG
jgi:succinyl-CoA reductase